MSKVKATIITKGNNLPGNQMSIDIKKDSAQKPVEDQRNELILTPPYNTSALAALFNMNAYHKRCCLVKAGITVRLGYTIYDPGDPNRKTKDDEEYNRAKDFLETYLEELHNFQLDHEIFGNGYLEIVRNLKGKVAEVYHITAKDSSIRLDNKVRLLRETIAGTTIDYVPYMRDKYNPDEKKRHEYIHYKNYNPENRYYGVPEYSGSISTMYLDENAKTYNTNRFSDPVPETLIAVGSADKAVEDTITKFFQSNFGDSTKAGRKALLLQFEDSIGDLKEKIIIEKLERENKDAAFRGLRSDNREEIISAHGLTPRLVGVESVGKLSGGGEVREQLRLINEIVFIPRKKQLARIINSLFVGMEIKGWQMKFDNFEFANAAEDATFYSTMVSSGIITADYAAQEMGYPAPSQQGGEISKSDKFAELAKQLKQLRLTLESMREE